MSDTLLKQVTSWRNAIVTLAFSSTDDNDGIRSPYGGYPGYLSLMLSDFNRAAEAWLVGASHDFTPVWRTGPDWLCQLRAGAHAG